MPELPPPKRRPIPTALRPSASIQQYAELHCKTNFSFLEGASHADELVSRAIELGYRALAITDRSSLAGVVRAHSAARETDLKLIIGAELTPSDGPPIVVFCTDRASYGRLSRLLTVGRRRAPKGECELQVDDIAEHSAGLVAAVVPVASAPEARGSHPLETFHDYRDIFAEHGCYLFAEFLRGTRDERWLDQLLQLSEATNLPLVAAGDVHYHVPERLALQHVLTAIRNGTTVSEAGEQLLPNAQRHLRTIGEINALFAQLPDCVRRTIEIADRCTFSLDELRYDYPRELAPEGETPIQYLRRLTWEGARTRYAGDISDKVRNLVNKELDLIEELHYEAYFLTVWDLVRFARSRNILCQGRGSAANSAVCYCLGVTSVDPDQMEVLFERFVSRERNEAPDIDIDFEHERREEVLQYIYAKYGRDRAGMTAVVITYRARSAVRDVGKALGMSLDRVDALAKNLDFRSRDLKLEERCRESGIDPDTRVGRQLLVLSGDLIGFPRHLSQHVGGMVMTQRPLCELVPIENAAMADRTVIQWDKDDLDELGILKVDCLALGMLTAIHKCFDLIEQQTGRKLELDSVPREDADVYQMIRRADTLGLFQIESRAQMSMLPRLRPREFYDLVIQVAIVRPGPIQGNMVHPYLRRRNGEEPVTYPNEETEAVLRRTLGVPLFQEQAMQLAIVAAGFTPGEADQLRRAMGGWRRPGLIDRFRKKLIDGMLERNLSRELAENLFNQIRGFGEYGFPESHAASFAKLAYISAWLKYHYQAAYTAGVLNSQPMGFYAPAQLVRDAREHDVEIRPIDVNHSNWDCTLEPLDDHVDNADSGRLPPDSNGYQVSLRLGLRLLRGLPIAAVEAIESARGTEPFRTLNDFIRRTRLGSSVLQRLADADVFQSLKLDRRTALWFALDQNSPSQPMPLLVGAEPDEDFPILPKLSEQEEVFTDYATAGLTLREHPLSFCREELNQRRVVPAEQLAELPHNRPVRVAGLVLMRQRPSTAKGITFVTLEDETGIANLVVHQHTWERYYRIARAASAFIAYGQLERQNDVIHVVVRHLEDFSARLYELHAKSRDFR